ASLITQGVITVCRRLIVGRRSNTLPRDLVELDARFGLADFTIQLVISIERLTVVSGRIVRRSIRRGDIRSAMRAETPLSCRQRFGVLKLSGEIAGIVILIGCEIPQGVDLRAL